MKQQGKKMMRWLYRVAGMAFWGVYLGCGSVERMDSAARGAASVDTVNAVLREEDYVTGWWKTDAPDVMIGKDFVLTITLRYLRTDSARVVVDSASFDPLAVDLKPFEVIGAVREYKFRETDFVFHQYQFTLRLMDESLIGTDVALPKVEFPFRLDRRIEDGTFVEGAEHRYILPKLPIRVLSIVPKEAHDIRDIRHRTFDEVAATRHAALVALIVAVVCGLSAVMVLGRAIISAFRRRSTARREAGIKSVARVRKARLVGALLRRLRGVSIQAHRAGWNDSLAFRMLSISRLAASAVLNARIAYSHARVDEIEEGQVLVVRRFLRKHGIVASSPMTGDVLRLAASENSSARQKNVLGHLADAMDALTRHCHDARAGRLDASALGESAAHIQNALLFGYSWYVRWAARIRAQVFWVLRRSVSKKRTRGVA